MWQPDPTTLRMFISICEEGSIARASAREGMAAAAVSKRITDMEQELGTQLLLRRSRGVCPTPAGEILLRHAKLLTHSVENLHADLSELATGARGLVRVFANISSIVEFLPEQIASFLQINNRINVVLEERNSSDVVRGVVDGIADIGICRDFVSADKVEMIPFRSDHFSVVVHRDHPLASRKSVPFTDALDYEQIGLSVNASINALTRRIATEKSRQLRYRANVSTFDAAFRLISANLGVGVLPAEAITRYKNFYDLCEIPLTDDWATRRFAICVQSMDQLSIAARRFLDHLLVDVTGDSYAQTLTRDSTTLKFP